MALPPNRNRARAVALSTPNIRAGNLTVAFEELVGEPSGKHCACDAEQGR